MGLSFWHLLIVLAVVLIVFGAGRLPRVMGDLGRGIRSFKSGLDGSDKDEADKKIEKKD
jgi:sec-independent protein translocase protein TatA